MVCLLFHDVYFILYVSFFVVTPIGEGNNRPSLRLILITYICMYIFMYVCICLCMYIYVDEISQ